MPSKNQNVYFPDAEEGAAVMAEFKAMSETLGLGGKREFLTAITSGEVVVWMPDDINAMLRVAERMKAESGYKNDAFESLATAIRTAAERQIALNDDADDMIS